MSEKIPPALDQAPPIQPQSQPQQTAATKQAAVSTGGSTGSTRRGKGKGGQGSGSSGGKQPPEKMGNVVSRDEVKTQTNKNQSIVIDSGDDADFESNLTGLLNKVLEVICHDRAMAMAMLQVYLDRGEELDGMSFTMPVAQIISNNTDATLKAMDASMKAGDRLHKIAELLVNAKKTEEVNLIQMLKLELNKAKESGWEDMDQLPPLNDGSQSV